MAFVGTRISYLTKPCLVAPFAASKCRGQTCAPECNAGGSGMQLAKHTTYSISLWARSQSNSGKMHLEVLTGDWVQDPVQAAAFHTVGAYVPNQTLVSSTTTETWQHISTTVAAARQDRCVVSAHHTTIAEKLFIVRLPPRFPFKGDSGFPWRRAKIVRQINPCAVDSAHCKRPSCESQVLAIAVH